MFNFVYVNWIFRYIKKEMFVEVGKSEISPDFGSLLKLLVAQNEYLAFAPDTEETHFMLNALAMEFPLVKVT
jgi:ATP-binding cassette, subfamily A (ABC1), member 3